MTVTSAGPYPGHLHIAAEPRQYLITQFYRPDALCNANKNTECIKGNLLSLH